MESNTELTTTCYLEQQGKYLMLHRTKKQHDINKDKWIGIGGHFEYGESPEECIQREMTEECGITLSDPVLRGIISFVSDLPVCVYMFLFTATAYKGELLKDCNEGDLEWVDKNELLKLPLWTGDKIFLKLLGTREEFFSLKLCYEGDKLVKAVLDGNEIDPKAYC